MMDYETVSPADLGRNLTGLGVNLLCRDVTATADFLRDALGLTIHRASVDFALARYGTTLIQLHRDATFATHPLHDLLPETAPRGTGVQIYLFGIDPDTACARAGAAGGMVIEPPRDKPHGLREATLLGPDGHAFSPAVAL
jgi:catechol 2,3-dioxygenase-like lactoylglutathione lyase family enzyme